MRFVSINFLEEGMVLGKDLLGPNAEILLVKGTVLKGTYIQKLKRLGYNGVYIEDELSSDIVIDEVISTALRVSTIKSVKEVFNALMDRGIISDNHISSLNKNISDIIDEILANDNIIINMIDLKSFDDYTFFHSVNVAVLSTVLGVELRLKRDQLKQLCLAAILHDIGKVFIPKEILNKPTLLTDEEFEKVKEHSYLGYNYLKERFDIPAFAYVGILHHHERFDGRGYPSNLKGDKISLFGRIISVADVYDALTSNRPYRSSMSPSEAIEYIMGGGGTYFDPIIAGHFVRKIAPYPVGTKVKLSNYDIAIVVENYPDCSIRPKVRVFQHLMERCEPYILDLRNDPGARGITILGAADEEYSKVIK